MKHGFTDWVTWGQPYLRINHPCWTFDGHGISNLEFENDPRFKGCNIISQFLTSACLHRRLSKLMYVGYFDIRNTDHNTIYIR